MAVVLVQVDDELRLVDPENGVSTLLTLPDDVAIDGTRRMSVASLKLGAAIVNAPSRNLYLTSSFGLILLNPSKPSTALTAGLGAAGNLTGDYQWAVSFIHKDGDDNVLSESAMSALSTAVAFTADAASLTAIPVSADTDTVTGRRLYRTLSGGSVLYFLADIDDNTTTTYTDDATDASLNILAENGHRTAEIDGTNASDEFRLRYIVSWKNRLWALSENPAERDNVLYTEDGLPYRWGSTAALNELPAYPEGQDIVGVVGMAPRKDQLGVLKRTGVWQITGDSDLSFHIVQIAFGKNGCISDRSIVVIGDKEAFWHAPDGVVLWDNSGVNSITDSTVAPWFKTDRYFNREFFEQSFGKYNEIRDAYDLHLVHVDEEEEDSQYWVSYNRTTRAWYGPHKTDLSGINFNAATKVETEFGVPKVLVGGDDGIIYTLTPDTYHDGSATAIALDVLTQKFNCDTPNIEKEFGELDVLTRVETINGTLGITATLEHVERDDPNDTVTLGVELTQGRERCGRLGTGRSVQLEFTQSDLDQPCTLEGFELPFAEIGTR